MSVSTLPGAAPIFASAPALTKDADTAAQIVATSMQSIVHRIYQMDPTAYWQGSLGASDSNTEVITMGLYKGSSQYATKLDIIALLNNNLKHFKIEYCTDFTPGTGGAAGTGTWMLWEEKTDNDGSDYYSIQASPIASINGLRISMYSTAPTANQQKKLGNFIPALISFQLSQPPSKYTKPLKMSRVDNQMADGTPRATYFLWSDNSCVLFDVVFEFDFLNVSSAVDKSNLDSIFLLPGEFTVIPEPGDTPRDVFLCRVDPKTYLPEYQQQWKGAGRKIPVTLNQIGYL